MATTAAGSLLTQAQQRAQLTLRAGALREALRLYPAWDLENIDETWEPFMVGMLAMLERFHTLSASQAGAYYTTLRTVEGAPGTTPVRLAPFDRDRATANLILLGPIMAKKAIGLGRSREAERNVAFSRLSGVVTAMVLAGSRDTIYETQANDPASRGIRRVITGTCEYCRSKAAEGQTEAQFKAHSNCGCIAEPSFHSGTRHIDPLPTPRRDRLTLGLEELRALGIQYSHTGTGDPILEKLYSMTGYNSLPQLVDDDVLTAMLQTHQGDELMRGLRGNAAYLDEFKTGEYYPGQGVWGNGTYTAYGPRRLDVATGFSDGEGWRMRMMLKPDAKAAPYSQIDELRRAHDEYLDAIAKQSRDAREVAAEIARGEPMDDFMERLLARSATARDDALARMRVIVDDPDLSPPVTQENFDLLTDDEQFQLVQALRGDTGRTATLFGYDAMVVEMPGLAAPGTAVGGEVVVLNRGALIVSKQDF